MTVARLLGSGFPPIGGVTVLRALLGLVISAAAWGQTGTAITTFGPNNSFSPNSWCVSGANTSDCGPAVDRYIAAPFTPSSALTVSSIILPLVSCL